MERRQLCSLRKRTQTAPKFQRGPYTEDAHRLSKQWRGSHDLKILRVSFKCRTQILNACFHFLPKLLFFLHYKKVFNGA